LPLKKFDFENFKNPKYFVLISFAKLSFGLVLQCIQREQENGREAPLKPSVYNFEN